MSYIGRVECERTIYGLITNLIRHLTIVHYAMHILYTIHPQCVPNTPIAYPIRHHLVPYTPIVHYTRPYYVLDTPTTAYLHPIVDVQRLSRDVTFQNSLLIVGLTNPLSGQRHFRCDCKQSGACICVRACLCMHVCVILYRSDKNSALEMSNRQTHEH